MGKIRVGVIGVGNCFAGLAQGIEYYTRNKTQKLGLMHEKLGGYGTEDVEFVSAFDVGENKVGKPLNEAIFSNSVFCITFYGNVRSLRQYQSKGQT